MHKSDRFRLVVFMLLSSSFGIASQTDAIAQGTVADYLRSAGLRSRFDKKVFKTKIEPHWSANNKRLWYRNDLADGKREYIQVDIDAAKREPAFDHQRLAKVLSESTKQEIQADNLPIDWIVLEDGSFTVSVKGKGWKVQVEDYSVTSVDNPERSRPQEFKRNHLRSNGFSKASDLSPDKAFKTFSRDRNLWLREEQGGKEHQLTSDGKDGEDYRSGVYWSPDSSHFIATKNYRGEEHIVHMVESLLRTRFNRSFIRTTTSNPATKSLNKSRIYSMLWRRKKFPSMTNSSPIHLGYRNIAGRPTPSGFRFITTNAVTR
jgi:hypothetical protein